MPCPALVWHTLSNMFQTISETAIDGKLTHLQAISLQEEGKITEYSNRLQGLFSELDSASHKVSDMEQKCTLQRGLPDDDDFTAESIMTGEDTFSCADSKLVLRETRLLKKDAGLEHAFFTRTKSTKS